MRTYTLVSIGLATIFFCNEYVAVYMVLRQKIWNPYEPDLPYIGFCRDTMCFTPDKCEQNRTTHYCMMPKGFVCCRVVKPEYRTHCHHHGGECMDPYKQPDAGECGPGRQPHAGECWANKICCVVIESNT